MKKTLLFVMLSSLFFVANAQRERVSRSRNGSRSASTSPATTSHFGIGIEGGLPIGENGKIYSAVIGGSLQYETLPDADFGITLSAGYLNFPLKSIYKTAYGPNSAGFVPLLAGFKYYFTPNAFLHGQLGAAIGTATGQGTSFAYSPGLGLKLSPNIDAELKYMGISNKAGTIGDVALRLGYNF